MNPPNLPPHVQLIQLGTAYWISTTVIAAARIGLADHLVTPKSADEIAPALGLHAPSLYRLMRTLASLGVFTESDGNRFGLTPMGALLRSDVPGSVRTTIRTLGAPYIQRGFEHFEHALQTGQPGFDKAYGMPAFDYLAAHPVEAAEFSETMVGFHGDEPPAVASAYDFSDLGTIVDVGGATGNLLATILAAHPGPRGVLFDLPHVVTAAPDLLAKHGVAVRVDIVSGSFFDAVPAGGDAYIMSHIIHDWSEAQCLAILGACRAAMKPTSRLLLVEMVLPAGDAPHLGKILDMVMLAVPGGRERTASEYNDLLAKAGFRVQRVVPTPSAVSVIEAVPA